MSRKAFSVNKFAYQNLLKKTKQRRLSHTWFYGVDCFFICSCGLFHEISSLVCCGYTITLRTRKKALILQTTFSNSFSCLTIHVWELLYLIKIPLNFVPTDPINNNPALVQIMARRRTGISIVCSIHCYTKENIRAPLYWPFMKGIHMASPHKRPMTHKAFKSWWRHQMETFSALLALCAGNSPVTGEFPAQRPVTRNFDVFFDLHLNKRLSKQSWGWWFETPSWSLWRHCNGRTVWYLLVLKCMNMCTGGTTVWHNTIDIKCGTFSVS